MDSSDVTLAGGDDGDVVKMQKFFPTLGFVKVDAG